MKKMVSSPEQSSAEIDHIWCSTILTLFPDMFPGPLGMSLAGKALIDGIWAIDTLNIRDFSDDGHYGIDDAPFGGGAGMIMRADVIDKTLKSVDRIKEFPIVYLTPRGKPFKQARARELARGTGVVVLCGHYEGVDNRVVEAWNMEEISIGDFILSGGEVAALTLIDTCVRLLPGVAGNVQSTVEESFENGLLEYPHYTRPQEWNGHQVPEVLISGHHEKVKNWRQSESEKITAKRRPDLWQVYNAKGEAKYNSH